MIIRGFGLLWLSVQLGHSLVYANERPGLETGNYTLGNRRDFPCLSIVELSQHEVNLGSLFEFVAHAHTYAGIVPRLKHCLNVLQTVVTSVIYDQVKAGRMDFDIEPLQQVVDGLAGRGAEAVILGCTELPVVFPRIRFSAHILDPTEILARAALRFAGALS